MIYLKSFLGGLVGIFLAALALLALNTFAPRVEILSGFTTTDPMGPVLIVAPLAFAIGFQWMCNRASRD